MQTDDLFNIIYSISGLLMLVILLGLAFLAKEGLIPGEIITYTYLFFVGISFSTLYFQSKK